ncbi:MAG: metallophosphoesterase [Bacteroides sp.]|nr:metallophosphoesterase [Bacteroides sp.]MCM1379267.1 metallophosphoesterase [Bacteroides sp.]MCM1445075.1 metallophosphoesterase [Prevotella sp.]
MRIPLVLALALLILQLATDTYLFFVAQRRLHKPGWAKFQLYESVFFVIYVIVIFFSPARTGATESGLTTLMWMVFVYLMVYFAKAAFVIFDLLAQLPKLWDRHRAKWLTRIGGGLAVLIVALMSWGAWINRYRIQLKEVEIPVSGLPESFDGYRIVQISDLHLGTFGSDTTFVSKLVDRVNALNPNLVVFTGDIVNQRAAEAEPFIRPLSRIEAADGVFSILGNHDYGDYVVWSNPADKEENMERLFDQQIEMGWELLTNSSEIIRGSQPGDSLVIVGVENWGDPPFPQYGDIDTAYPTSGDDATKILLTHNPRHWTDVVSKNDTLNYILTLSGHTHAMQMELFGLSPAAFRYPDCWGGLYTAPDGRKLYVNIGAGCVGMPMRIGATPEITLFTLKQK